MPDKEKVDTKKTSANRGRRSRKSNQKTPDNSRKQEVKVEGRSTTVNELIRNASNIYFSNIIGSDISLQSTQTQVSIPGILRYDAYPNFMNRSDMINTAATSIYTYVRHANAGKTNYESSDLMLYLIQMGDLMGNLTNALRAFGLYNYFTARNIYSGHLIKALGFDMEDIRQNAADYRWRFNSIINKIKAFAIPKTFHYFEEVINEYNTVYSDEDDVRAQLIFVRPKLIAEFDPTTMETGGVLKFSPIVYGLLSEYLDKIESILDDIRTNEDMNIISGDILKAYGDNLFSLGPVEIDFEVRPIYDIIKLMQFQNAHVPTLHSNHISLIQVNNKLHQPEQLLWTDETQKQLGNLTDGKRYVNCYFDDVDADIIFALTKYQVVTESGDDAGMTTSQIISGNILVLANMTAFMFDKDLNLGAFEINQVASEDLSIQQIKNWFLLSKFKFHTYLYSVDALGNGIKYLPLGDMHNVAVISPEDTQRMNDSRFIMIFQTPQMG